MKKVILFGLLWWVVIFVEVSVIGFTPGLATMSDNGFTLLPVGFAIHAVLVVILSCALAWLYYRKPVGPVPPHQVALIVAAVGLALDAAITVPFFVKDYGLYYSKWTLWAGLFIFIVIFSTAAGFFTRRQAT